MKKNVPAAIVVSSEWANLAGNRVFLRKYHDPSETVRGESHLITARVLDSTDPHGLWIQLYRGEHEKDPAVQMHRMMIPWQFILSIVVSEEADFFADIQKAGFTKSAD